MNREDVAIDVTIQDKHPEQAGGDERAAFEQWEAEQIAFVLRQIGSMDADDIDNDNVDLRFEDASGRDTGCDVSIVDYAEKAASLIEAMLSDRAALAQPSQSQYEASFEEWLANELEGEDGQPVPAAFCDIALARRAFNHWPKLEHPAKVGGVRFSAGVSSRLVVEAAQRLYEFESTPEKEAERPEVVAVRYEDGTILSAEECGIALEVCAKVQTPLMTVSQHERIVGALRAEITQLRQHKNDYMDAGQETYRALQNEIREREAEIARLDGLVSGRTAERDAALVEVERLRESKGDPVGSLEKCMKVMYERDEHAKRLEAAMARVAELEKELAMARDAASKGDAARHAACGMEMDIQELKAKLAELEKQEPLLHINPLVVDELLGRAKRSPGGLTWSKGRCGSWTLPLYAAPPAQAQHSVPDGAADLCRFLAKLYCELDGLRYSTAKLPAEQIADALIFKWPVLQGARNQLNIKRISEQPYDESKLHSAIAAMLAAAPGKEGV